VRGYATKRMDEDTTWGETLYDRFALPMYTYVCQHVSNKQDAEDLLMEVFLTAFKSETLASLPAKQQLAWLMRLTRNKIIDRYRHLARHQSVSIELAGEVEDGAPSPEEYVVQQERYERLFHALEQLSPLQQRLIWLHHTKSLRFFEIASMFEKSEDAVRQMYSHTLRQLRGIYQQTGREAGMNGFDEKQLEEKDPEHEELLTLLQHANLDAMFVDPQDQEQTISKVRARLFPTDHEVAQPDAHEMSELGSLPSNPRARHERIVRLVNVIAAVLVVAVLIGSVLLLFGPWSPLRQNHLGSGPPIGPVGAPVLFKDVTINGFESAIKITPGPYFLGELLEVDLAITNHTHTTYWLIPEVSTCAFLQVASSGGGSPNNTDVQRSWTSLPELLKCNWPWPTIANPWGGIEEFATQTITVKQYVQLTSSRHVALKARVALQNSTNILPNPANAISSRSLCNSS
jgi:RNA polymerase sigma factor (sigma-70 family)